MWRLAAGGSGGGGEKWLASGFIVKVELTAFADGPAVQYVRGEVERRQGWLQGVVLEQLEGWSCHLLERSRLQRGRCDGVP